jgi:hypothetical protein
VVTGWIVYRFADWQMPLLIMGGPYSLSAIPWTQVDPRQALRATQPVA